MAQRDWKQLVGSNVRRLRQARDLTQEKLAGEADIDPTYLRAIEAGRRNPSLLVIVGIAEALGVRPVELLKSER